MAQAKRLHKFIDANGKERFVHPSLATNKKFLNSRGLMPMPEKPKAPPVAAAAAVPPPKPEAKPAPAKAAAKGKEAANAA